MNAGLDVLNCSAGHLKLSFDPDKPGEAEKAQKVLLDCMKRGYAVLVEKDGEHKRVRGFDSKTGEYIIDEPTTPTKADAGVSAKRTGKKGRAGASVRLSARHHRATAIGPTAGG